MIASASNSGNRAKRPGSNLEVVAEGGFKVLRSGNMISSVLVDLRHQQVSVPVRAVLAQAVLQRRHRSIHFACSQNHSFIHFHTRISSNHRTVFSNL